MAGSRGWAAHLGTLLPEPDRVRRFGDKIVVKIIHPEHTPIEDIVTTAPQYWKNIVVKHYRHIPGRSEPVAHYVAEGTLDFVTDSQEDSESKEPVRLPSINTFL